MSNEAKPGNLLRITFYPGAENAVYPRPPKDGLIGMVVGVKVRSEHGSGSLFIDLDMLINEKIERFSVEHLFWSHVIEALWTGYE